MGSGSESLGHASTATTKKSYRSNVTNVTPISPQISARVLQIRSLGVDDANESADGFVRARIKIHLIAVQVAVGEGEWLRHPDQSTVTII